MTNLYEVINRCQQIIISSMRGINPECTILFAKDRVDETNLHKVKQLSDSLLDKEKAEQVRRALEFMKRAVNELCVEHHDWAITCGEFYSRMYRIPHIDANSLALEGLYKATLRYKPHGSFKAYAASWIRQCIQRSRDPHMSFALDDFLKEGEHTTRIDFICSEDTLWGKSHFFARKPFELEELRQEYCPHLSMEQMQALLTDKNLADSLGC